MEDIGDDQTFEEVVIAHASTMLGVAFLVTGDEQAARDAVDEAWPQVYRRWPRTVRAPHRLATALAPVVAAAVRHAPRTVDGRQFPGLQLHEDVLVARGTVPGTGSPADPVGEALLDLSPRRRAVLALRWYAGLRGVGLVRAVRLRPLHADRVARQALGEVVLTAGLSAGNLTGPGDDPTAVQADLVQEELASRASAVYVDARVELDRVRRRVDGVRPLRPRRLRPRQALAGAACALVAAVVGTVLVLLPAGDGGSTEHRLPVPPRAPQGSRLVGYRTVYAVVPSTWSHNQVECGQPVAETVVYPDARSGCDPGRSRRGGVPVSSVTFAEPPTSPVPLGRLHEVDSVGGDFVFATRPVRKASVLQQVVVIPGADVMMTVRSTHPPVLAAIAGSLRALPAGYTVVPPCEGRPLREAVGLLTEAGLRVRLTQASTLSERVPPPPVTHQTLASGRIVSSGTVVGLGFPSRN